MTLRTLATVVLTAFLAAAAPAATIWTGAVDTDWTVDGNWNPATAPDAATDVELSGALTANQPDIGATARIRSLDVQSTGWVISSTGGTGTLELDADDSTTTPYEINLAAGVNATINANVNFYQAYQNVQTYLDAGSTLTINGSVTGPNNRILQVFGSGKLVVNGDTFSGRILQSGNPAGTNPTGSFILNVTNYVVAGEQNQNPVLMSGQTLGGTLPEIQIFQYLVLAVESGATIAPGAETGDRISTLNFRSTSDTIRASVTMDSGAFIEMDLGNSAGVSDLITLGQLSSDFALGGCTLALINDGGLVAGDYTLFTETLAGSDVTGAFGAVTLNGSALTEGVDYTISYPSAETGSVVLTMLVPEPTTLGLLGLGAVAMLKRRRK